MGANSISPGPGNYQLDSMAFNKQHKFHMGIKLNDADKFNTPGPGAHNPEFNNIK